MRRIDITVPPPRYDLRPRCLPAWAEWAWCAIAAGVALALPWFAAVPG